MLQTVFLLRRAALETEDFGTIICQPVNNEILLMHCSKKTVAVNRPSLESVVLQKGGTHVFLLGFLIFNCGVIFNVHTDAEPRMCICLPTSTVTKERKKP